jgi:aminoglycoside/choline kinase family phosphotransferase
MAVKRETWQERAEHLIREEAGLEGPFRWQPLHGDGSDRVFYRVFWGAETLVVCWCPPGTERFPNENDSYVYMGRHLQNRGTPVPRILAYSRPEGMIVMEDLGSVNLQEALARDRGALENLYGQAIEILLQMQVRASEDLDTEYCFDTPVYDSSFVMHRELRYFHESFMQAALGLGIPWEQMEGEFSLLASHAAGCLKQLFFLHRDFQSRNLMVRGGHLYLIDFQGARLGPPQYDLAALLLDPYVQVPEPVRCRLLATHSRKFSEYTGLPASEFLERYPHVALCRNLQILAAFSFLTRVKGRTHFAPYIVPAWQQLRQLLAQPACTEYVLLTGLVQSQSDDSIAEMARRMEQRAQSGEK